MLTSLQKNALKAGVIVIVFVIGFLLGYVPQNSKLEESNAANEQSRLRVSQLEGDLDTALFSLKLASLRDQLSLLHIEVLNKNYGNATQMASKYFDGVREAMVQAKSTELKDFLSSLLQNRDSVTAALARGDPEVVNQFQNMLIRFHQLAGKTG